MLDLAQEVRRLKDSGRRVIDLSLGQPDVPAPTHIAAALREAAKKPSASYSATAGSANLRELIAKRYTESARVDADPSEVIVTPGSKHALFVTLLSLLDPGEEVLVPEPFFPPYGEIASLIGAKLRTVPISWTHNRSSLDVEDFLGAATRKTKVVLLNYPNNPAGWTLEGRQLKAIADFCSNREIYLVADEIYDRIVFDDRKHKSAWAFSNGSDWVVSIGSFSKTYSMIPYRLGYLVARSGIAREILKAVRATVTMVSPFVQQAGCAALTGPQDFVSQRLAKYQERRDRSISYLRRHGVRVPTPEGAFYLFTRLPRGTDVPALARKLLSQKGVAVLTGGAFGSRWEDFVRFSLGTSDPDLYEGLEKFVSLYQQIQSTSTD